MKIFAVKLILLLALLSVFFITESCNKKPDNAPLTEQSLQNLIAFTKLYGYVRFFHPSSEAQKIDWNKFAVYGTEKVEDAKNSDELKKILKELFLPIAPSLIIYDKNNYKDDELKTYSPENPAKLKEVLWKYHSFADEVSNDLYYKSIGENKHDSLFKELPLKDKYFRVEIGNNLSIILPIVLYSDSVSTLPRGDIDKVNDLLKKDSVNQIQYKEINRYVRFAGITIAWNIFQHFYPYRNLIKTNWQDELSISLKSAAVDTSKIDYLNTLKRFTAKLEDGHTSVIFPNSDGNYYYPGLRWEVIENQLVITDVLNEIKDKVAPGDVILEIDGIRALERLAVFDSLVSGATVEWKRTDQSPKRKGSLELLASGKENSILKLKVLHKDKTSNLIELVRNRNYYNNEIKPDKVFEIKNGIYYVDMTRCSLDDYNKIRPKLTKSKGIIYDCRGFPSMFGIYFSDMTRDTLFAAFKWYSSLILYPDGNNTSYYTRPPLKLPGSSDYIKAPKVVITNANAISGAESILLTIQYHKLATLIGEHTAGTSGVMDAFTLPGGYTIWYTGHLYQNYDGSRFSGIGVIQDIPCSKTIKGISEGRDEQLEKALEVITSKIK